MASEYEFEADVTPYDHIYKADKPAHRRSLQVYNMFSRSRAFENFGQPSLQPHGRLATYVGSRRQDVDWCSKGKQTTSTVTH
jgi:hypothetical protein